MAVNRIRSILAFHVELLVPTLTSRVARSSGWEDGRADSETLEP